MIRPGRLWWLLRRDLARGWQATFHHYSTLEKIAGWRFAPKYRETLPLEVHMVTGERDWRLALWALASWCHFTGRRWRFVVHDDGSLPPSGRDLIGSLFPGARVRLRAEADLLMEKRLADYPLSAAYRQSSPLGLKVFDIPVMAADRRYIVLDSDLLFFGAPEEILRWATRDDDTCWFNRDVAEASLVSAETAKENLGLDLWPRVNSGLCLVAGNAVDLEFCERCLRETGMMDGGDWKIEQTLYALCASRHGRGGLLPRTYEVSLGRQAARDAICRHYVGAVRDRFYAEGLSRLKPILLNGR